MITNIILCLIWVATLYSFFSKKIVKEEKILSIIYVTIIILLINVVFNRQISYLSLFMLIFISFKFIIISLLLLLHTAKFTPKKDFIIYLILFIIESVPLLLMAQDKKWIFILISFWLLVSICSFLKFLTKRNVFFYLFHTTIILYFTVLIVEYTYNFTIIEAL